MKRGAWEKFVKARDNYRAAVLELERSLPKLRSIQQKLVNSRSLDKTGAYTVETPIVYNCALDNVTIRDDIRLILAADNPGRREQAAENRRYLVGPSGKIAEKFFRDNPSLGIDFRQNAIILNKTPIHTPRTVELRELCRLGGPSLEKALAESQRIMARLLVEFHLALYDSAAAADFSDATDFPDAAGHGGSGASLKVWIIGYSEMKKNGLFESYTETLCDLYAKKNAACLFGDVLLFRHFSMNQFTIDLRRQSVSGKSPAENLEDIGTAYRRRVLGW
jgi:hypothetical protein